jgi:hypothetical protein
MTREPTPDERDRGEIDPGPYIGSQPEREAETIPGGVSDRDERVAAYGSQPGAAGEPDDGNELASDTGDIINEAVGAPSRPDGPGSSDAEDLPSSDEA